MEDVPSFGLPNLSGVNASIRRSGKYDPTPLGFEPMPKKKDSCWARHHRVWVSTSIGLSFFSIGMTTSSLGIIVEEAYQKFAPPPPAQPDWFGLSFVFFAHTLGHILGSISASLALDKFSFSAGRANCFFLATIGTALATASHVDGLWKLLTVFAFMGVGIGWIETIGNKTLMGLYAERVDIFMQSVHIAFGVGASASPWLIKLTVSTLNYKYYHALWIVSALLIAAAIMTLVLAFGDLPEDRMGILALNAVGTKPHSRIASESGSRPWQHRVVILVCSIILFAFSMTHQFMTAWLYRYTFTFNFNQFDADIVVSIYWGAFTLTRLIAKLLNFVTPTFSGFACLLGCVLSAFFLTVPLFQYKFTLWIITALIGLFNSGVFISVLAIPTEFFVWVRAPDSWFFSLMMYQGAIAGPLTVSLAWNQWGSRVVSWILLIVFTSAFFLLVLLFLFIAFSSTMKRHIARMNKSSPRAPYRIS